MTTVRFVLLTLLLLTLLPERAMLRAQSPCYARVREDGLQLMAQGRFGDAISQFWAAWASCEDKPAGNDLEKLIKQAQAQWVRDLEGRIDREKRARDEANEARQNLATANQALEKEREIALANAALAREQGRKAEALRLVLLSEQVRQQGRRSDALLLAFLALRMTADNVPPSMLQTFGAAARDSLAQRLAGRDLPIRHVQPLPGPGRYLLQFADQSVWVHDAPAGATTPVLPAAEMPRALTVAPDGGSMLVWAGASARIVDFSGQVRAVLTGHTEPIRCATFSPDGQLVVTGGRDHTARLWNAGTGALVAVLRGHTGNVYGVGFAPDGSRLLTRSSDGTVRLWTASGEASTVLPAGAAAYVHDACFESADAVLTVGADGFLRRWSAGGQLLDSVRVSGSPLVRVRPLAGSPAFLLLDAAGAARSWNPGERSVQTLGSGVPLVDACFSPDRRWLLTTGTDGTARLIDDRGNVQLTWALATDTPVGGFFSSDGKKLLVVEQNNRSLTELLLPDEVLPMLERQYGATTPAAQRLKREFDLQFIEEVR